MVIGIVVAIKEEASVFSEFFGKGRAAASDIYEVTEWHEGWNKFVMIRSGYGEIAAAAATQYLIDNYPVDQIINYGVVGALHDNLNVHQVGIVHKIVHYGFDLSGGGKYPRGIYPKIGSPYIEPKIDIFADITELPSFICASSDKFVYGGSPKRELHNEFNADICDMESAGIILTCNKNSIPCGFIKAVSDGVEEDEKAFEENVLEASRKCVDILSAMIRLITPTF